MNRVQPHRERDGLVGWLWEEDIVVLDVTAFDDLTCSTTDYRFVRGAGLPNFASSIGTFVFISFSTIESRPSSHT